MLIVKINRAGKSYYQAARAAHALKNGQNVVLASKRGLERIVCVPGFDDGRQITQNDTIVARATAPSSHSAPDLPLDPRKSAI
jgi:hypothetical protein